MQLTRATNATALNAIVNDPSIYPWIHGPIEGAIDLTPVVANPNNYALIAQHGAIVFAQHSPGLYEVHNQVLPAGRGPWALEMTQAALHWQFTHTDALEIWTRVPKGNLAARALAKRIGGSLQFRAERGWIVGGQIVWADIFSLTIQEWIKSAPGLAEVGAQFHMKLHEEYHRLGRQEPSHSDDPVHDRFVGAAVEMFRSGQPHKGQVFYNRFAGMAGYEPITILRTDPVMIDIRDAVLELHGQNFFVASLANGERH